MQQERWKKIEAILDTALSLSGEEQTNYVIDACGNDKELLTEVYDILEAIEESEETNFLDGVLSDNKLFVEEVSDSQDSYVGMKVGAFKITDKLGSGGMGAVYRAERADGQFAQQVAIKLLQKGIQSKETLRRFRMEQEILASLKHPNIAQLYDGGTTNDGIPYLVMEYVDGVPIDQYCNQHRLTVDDRIALFKEVCKAVQFAHANLVIHRDLKAQNIYVTSEGDVKVLDFGIAKLLDPKLTQQTLLETRPGQKFWTPQYAAPEQVKSGAITTATDVYALGVLLHRLLTGTYPLELKDKSIAEIEQIIAEVAPTFPSQSVEKSEEPHNAAELHQITAADLKKKLSGDLDALVLKALRKEPEYRYDSVGQLIEDLERYSKGLPLVARKDTVSYRFKKFYRRNHVSVRLGSLLVVLLIVASFYYTNRITQERDQAEYEARRASQVSDFVVNLFYGNHPDISSGKNLSASDLLEIGLKNADTLSQPEIKADILDAIGRAYAGMGKLDKATPILEEVYKISSEYHGQKNAKPGIIMFTLGNLYRRKGEYEKAMEFSQKSLKHFQSISGDNRFYISRAYNALADIYFFKGNYEKAVAFHQQAYEIQIQIFDSTDSNIANTLNAMNASLYQQGKYKESKKIIDRVISIYKYNFGDKHPRTVEQYSNQALINYNTGNFEKAEEQSRNTLALKKEIYKDVHPSLAAEYNNLGKIITQQNKLEEADSLLRIAINMRKQIYGPTHIYLARSIHNLAKVLEQKGNTDEAMKTFDKALAVIRKSVPPTHPMITKHIIEFGDFYIQQDNIDDALTLLLNRELEITTGDLDNRNAGLLKQKIGICYLIHKDFEKAESYLLTSFKILEKTGSQYTNDRKQTLKSLVNLYEKLNRPEEADRYQKLLSELN